MLLLLSFWGALFCVLFVVVLRPGLFVCHVLICCCYFLRLYGLIAGGQYLSLACCVCLVFAACVCMPLFIYVVVTFFAFVILFVY